MTYIRFTDGSSVTVDAGVLIGMDVEPGAEWWVDVSPWTPLAGRRRVVVDFVADHAPIPDPEPDYEALLRRLVDMDPWVTWYAGAEDRCVACGALARWASTEAAAHDDDCPWVAARRAVSTEPHALTSGSGSAHSGDNLLGWSSRPSASSTVGSKPVHRLGVVRLGHHDYPIIGIRRPTVTTGLTADGWVEKRPADHWTVALHPDHVTRAGGHSLNVDPSLVILDEGIGPPPPGL